MEQVKTLFGFLMLFVPLILLERILPFEVILLMAGVLSIATAIYLHYWQSGQTQGRGKTILWAMAMTLFISGLMLVKNYVWPPTVVKQVQVQQQAASGEFVHVADLTELNELLANTEGLVMVDLYADWCVACKEFEHYTFPKEQVQQQFKHFTLVQIDLTDTNDSSIELMEAFTVFGLPSILFFNQDGKELPELRVTGFMGADDFAAHLQKVRDQAGS